MLWQGKHALVQPPSLFCYLSVPSLLLHNVIVDHESGPEAAVPARLQRRAEPHGEELGYWDSVRQLRVLGLGLQQFQLSRLQLGLRPGAGRSTDMTVRFMHRRPSAHNLHVSLCPGEVSAWGGHGFGVQCV